MYVLFKKALFFLQNLFKRNPVRNIKFLGVCIKHEKEFLIGAHKKSGELIFLPKQAAGFSYTGYEQGVLMNRHQRPIHAGQDIARLNFSYSNGTTFLTYTLTDNLQRIYVAASKDGKHFKERGSIKASGNASILTLRQEKKDVLVLMCGIDTVDMYISSNSGHSWKQNVHGLYTDILDTTCIFECATNYKDHILIHYSRKTSTHGIHSILVDNPNIHHVLWKSDTTLWDIDTSEETRLLDIVYTHTHLAIYTVNHYHLITEIILPYPLSSVHKRHTHTYLTRHEQNPILEPRDGHGWEQEAAFNPAAVIDDTGVIHMFYRAIGTDGVSRVGHALSEDGYTFTERYPYPVYAVGDQTHHTGPRSYAPHIYPSGGSWGGCEDPRIVRIDDHIYMTYVSFGGWNSIRMALTSLSLHNLKHKQWQWTRPLLLSNPKETHKNWVIFPEKIGGKYAILHGITPRILIEYVDSLTHIPTHIESERPPGPQIGRIDKWDNLVRGSGPPPLKTDKGWLLFYHAIDKKEPHRYKVGAMILDYKNPTIIRYRSEDPVLSPDMYYENNGKPGVVYASGAVIKDGTLFLYYGGADKVACVASAPLNTFLDAVVSGKSFTGIMRQIEFMR